MKYSTNYSLKKPDPIDIVNIDDFNTNADTIDNELKKVNDTLATNVSTLTIEVNKKANESDLQVERNRIDLLTKVQNGETQGNTELLDIRNGANGQVYETGADMIRDIAKGKGILDTSITRKKTTFYNLSTEGNLVSEDMNVYYYGFLYSVNESKIDGDFPTIKISMSDIDFKNNTLKFNFDAHITFWTKNSKFISGYIQGSITGTNNTALLHNIPDNADYVLFGIYKESLPTAVLCKKENYDKQLKTKYCDKSLMISTENLDRNIKIKKEAIEEIKINPYGNLIDKNKLIKNQYYNVNGNLVLESGIHTIELDLDEYNTSYKFNFNTHITFWDKDGAFISGYIEQSCNTQTPQTLKNIPKNVAKVRMLVYQSKIDTVVFSLASHFSNDLKCTYYIPGIVSDINNNTNSSKLYENGNLLEINKLVKGLVNQNGVYDPTSNDFTTDFLEIKDYKFDFVTMISFWNENKEFISGYIQGSVSPEHPATLTNKPDNGKYVRFTVWANDLNFAVLALSNTYRKNLKTYYYQENIVAADENISKKLEDNLLYGKSFVFFGDSWCAGNTSAPGGWATWLKKKHPSIKTKNCGIHGQDWEQAYNNWIANQNNWNSLSNDYDYIIIEAYTNGLYVDIDRLSKPLGTIDEFTYYNSDQEIKNSLGNTYACYLELFLFNIVKRYHGKKKMIMFPYKAVDHHRENNAFRKFRSEVIKCANKYNIKIYDNFHGCNIPTWSQEMIDTYFLNDGGHGDRVHLNALGYDIICPPMEASIKML